MKREELENSLIEQLNSYGDIINSQVDEIIKSTNDITLCKERVKKYIVSVKDGINEKYENKKIEEYAHKFSLEVVNNVYSHFLTIMDIIERETECGNRDFLRNG